MISKQSLFSRTWQYHILDGNRLGIGRSEGFTKCHYGSRHYKTQCAIGCNVSLEDGAIWSSLSGSSIRNEVLTYRVSNSVEKYPESVRHFLESLPEEGELIDFAEVLQNCHDNSTDLLEYRDELVRLADAHNLQLTGDRP